MHDVRITTLTASSEAGLAASRKETVGGAGMVNASSSVEQHKKRGRPKDSKNQEPKKRKMKPEPKPKLPAKVDVDKQCGVPLVSPEGEPLGGLCARSLTCKTHSMGAKRAVKGRSQAYDVLLSMYQQRNHLKAAVATAHQQSKRLAAAEADAKEESGEPPLSDAEEVAAVFNGAMHATPTPLDCKVLAPARMRTDQINIRELLYKSATVAPTPPPPVMSRLPLAAIMASTDAVLGRCILFNPITHAQSIRPSQVYAYERMQRLIQEKYHDRLNK